MAKQIPKNPQTVKKDKNHNYYIEYAHKQGHVHKVYGFYKLCNLCSAVHFASKNSLNRGIGKYCSVSCKAKDQKRSHKALLTLCHGRKWILKPGHPNAVKSGRYVQYSRYLMSQHLGRALKRCELVHHINFDKTDDRVENLQIVTIQEHNKIHKTKRQILET